MKLPPKCHRKHGAIYYVHRNKWHRLCDDDASQAEIYQALADHTRPPPPATIDELLDAYIRDGMAELRPATRNNYLIRITRLRRHFGHMAIDDLESQHVAQYLEGRKRQNAGVGGNRESATLAAAYNFGMRRGWARFNPCRGVSRNKERPRRRFIRDEEFAAACQRAPLRFRIVLQFAELTGLRQSDIRLLTWDQVTASGIEIEESKTGKRLLIGWTDDLRELLYLAWMLGPDRRVFRDSWGQPWGPWGIQSAMRRLNVDWTLHDVRARAESIHPAGLGLLTRYKRQKRIVPVR